MASAGGFDDSGATTNSGQRPLEQQRGRRRLRGSPLLRRHASALGVHAAGCSCSGCNERAQGQQQRQQQQQQLLQQSTTSSSAPTPAAAHATADALGNTNDTGDSTGGDGGSKEDEFWAWEEEAGTGLSVKDLLTTQADLQVKPIIFNRAIEAIDPPPFRDEKLPPACRKPPTTGTEEEERIRRTTSKLTPADLEAFLTVIYKSLATRDVPVADKVHVLAYLYRVSRVDGE